MSNFPHRPNSSQTTLPSTVSERMQQQQTTKQQEANGNGVIPPPSLRSRASGVQRYEGFNEEGGGGADANDDVPEKVPKGGKPQKFNHGVWDPEVAALRKTYFQIIITMSCITVLVMWACLSFYWGALWKERENVYRLRTWVIDFDDNSIVSRHVLTAIDASNAGPPPHLGWEVVSGDMYDTTEKIEALLVDEKAWAAVTINAGAEAALLDARQTGTSSYNGTSAVSAFYVQARNEIASNNFITPAFNSVLGAALVLASSESAADYLSAQSSNTTAIELLARAPSTVVNGFSFQLINLRAYDASVASAVTLVGFIYLLVLAFIQTMVHDAARAVLGPYLRTPDYIVLRIVVPAVNYCFIALLFSMINLPFRVPFGQGPFTHGGGWAVWWVFCWFGMMALGFATEAMITILTPRFIAFFLVAIIVVNASVASVPIELSGNPIYKVGYGLPFFNLSEAVRCIIFNTKNKLGQNFGVLCAWISVSCVITIPLFTILMRRREIKQLERERASDKEKNPDRAV